MSYPATNQRIVTADGYCEEQEVTVPPSTLESPADMAMRRDIEAELQWDPRLDDREIQVIVCQGVAILRGLVATPEALEAAAAIAGRTKGVHAVANELTLRTPSVAPVTDETLAAEAARLLAMTMATRATRIVPVVKDGRISLRGTVRFKFQRTAAEECLSRLDGVRGIDNRIVVKCGSGSHELRTRLARALRPSMAPGDALTIVLEGRKVCLLGHLSTVERLGRVVNAARSTAGVQSVNSRIALH